MMKRRRMTDPTTTAVVVVVAVVAVSQASSSAVGAANPWVESSFVRKKRLRGSVPATTAGRHDDTQHPHRQRRAQDYLNGVDLTSVVLDYHINGHTDETIVGDESASSSSPSSSSLTQQLIDPSTLNDEERSYDCTIGTGYYPTPGCKSYYHCSEGLPDTDPNTGDVVLKECISGLLFDMSTGICNWEAVVACTVTTSAPTTNVPTSVAPTLRPTSVAPTLIPTSLVPTSIEPVMTTTMAPLLGSTEEEEVVVVDVVEVSLEEETITTTTTTNSPSLSPMDLTSSSVAPTLIATTTADKTTTTATTVAAEATTTTTEATAFVPQTAWAPTTTTTAATTIPAEVGGANAIIAAASMSSNMVQVFPTDPSGLVISATAIGMKPIFPVTADGATAVVVPGLPQAASAASVYNDPKFHKRSSTHHKEIIAYWRSRGKVTTASDINYTKYTRINVASYIIDATGRIVIGSADAISEGEILFGPKVFEDKGDGESRNYCIQGIHETYCNMHEYKFGMIHLAHTVGTEVYATVSLGDVMSLATLNVDAFVADAIALMTVNGYDGLDLDFVMKETDENSSAPEKSAALQDAELLALEGVLSGIRMRINELMIQDERAYGLTLTLPCSTFRTPNIGSVIEFIDELNLRTFDFNTPSTSEVVAPNSPLYSYPDGPIDRSVDSCISDWTTSTESSTESIISRDRINIGLSFNGVVYHGAEALYGSHTTELSTEVDVMMSYHEIFPSLQNNEMSKGWDDVTKSIFGMNTWGELTTFEDVMSICWKTDYGINNDMNGFFVWDLTADFLDDKTTPLVDAITARLKVRDYDCTLGKSTDDSEEVTSNNENMANSTNATSMPTTNTTSTDADDLVTFTMEDGQNIMGWYGPPRYYPDYVSQICGDDPSQQPAWASSDDDLYQSKEECCIQNFQWLGRTSCLGANFVEMNFFTSSPTSTPSMMPSLMPSEMPSLIPSEMPSSIVITLAPVLQRPPPPPPRPIPSTSASSIPTLDVLATGRCARDDEHLAHIYRKAKPCSEMLLCPDGLRCFSAEVTESESVATESPTSSPSSGPGLCAVTEEELPLSFRTAPRCFDNQPCPEGLFCFTDVGFNDNATQDEIDETAEIVPWSTIDTEDEIISMSSSSSIEESDRGNGICAENEAELPLVFRTAPLCTDDIPCPSGLICFTEINEDVLFHVPELDIPNAAIQEQPYQILQVPYQYPLPQYYQPPPYQMQAPLQQPYQMQQQNPLQMYQPQQIQAQQNPQMYQPQQYPQYQQPYDTASSYVSYTFAPTTESPTTVAPTTIAPTTVSPTVTPTVDMSTPLPQPWKMFVDFSGKPYYFNPETGVTQWERPRSPPSGLCATDEAELPLVFRTASVCSESQPCDIGLQCFMDIDFKEETIQPTSAPTTESPISLAPTLSSSYSTIRRERPKATKTKSSAQSSEPVVLRATNDATIYPEDPSLNDGEATNLVVANSIPTSDVLISFDITSLNNMIPKKALLALYVTEACESAGEFSTTFDYDPNWNDAYAKDISIMPQSTGQGTLIGSFGQVKGSKWSGLDVTNAFLNEALYEHTDARGSTVITFRGVSEVNHRCEFGSIQGGKAPKLLIEF